MVSDVFLFLKLDCVQNLKQEIKEVNKSKALHTCITILIKIRCLLYLL